jgi:hypothetical protein
MAGVLLAGITARANPVPATSIQAVNLYMASENLRVTISPTDAVFNASFIFKSDPSPNTNWPITIQLPIWFPQNSTEDMSVAEFWATFDKERQNTVATTREKRVFDRAIGLNISAGNRRLMAGHPDSFIAASTNWWPENVTAPLYPPFFDGVSREELQSPGYGVLVIVISSDSDITLHGLPVAMTYRQPLVRSEGEGHFFYLPIFDNLPENISTADTNRYSITLAATPECSLTITAGSNKVTVARGQSVTLGPERHTPIQAVVDCPGFSPRIPVNALNDLYRYKTNFNDGESSRDYPNQLCFYVPRETPVAGARFVDLPKFPKLGFIKDEPALIITNLLSVEAGVRRTYTVVAGKPAEVDHPVIELKTRPKDGEGIKQLMDANANVNKAILITYEGKLLGAPVAMSMFGVDAVAWGVTNSDDLKDLVRTLKPLVR